MEIVVVTDDQLTRPGARLLAVIERAHRARLLGPQEYARLRGHGPDVGVVFLGDLDASGPLRALGRPRFDRHGVTVGVAANRAYVYARAVSDPTGTLRAIAADLDELQAVAAEPGAAAGGALEGSALAAAFLDPYLQVPAQTEVARRVSFSAQRMCWERQYTLGIAAFLRDGFCDFTASFRENP